MSGLVLPRYKNWVRTLGGLLLPPKRRPVVHRLSGAYPSGSVPAGIALDEGRLGLSNNCPPGCCGGGGGGVINCGFPCCYSEMDVLASGFGGGCSVFNGNFFPLYFGGISDSPRTDVWRNFIAPTTYVEVRVETSGSTSTWTVRFVLEGSEVGVYSGSIVCNPIGADPPAYITFNKVSSSCDSSPASVQARHTYNKSPIQCRCNRLLPNDLIITIDSECSGLSGSHTLTYDYVNDFSFSTCGAWMKELSGYWISFSGAALSEYPDCHKPGLVGDNFVLFIYCKSTAGQIVSDEADECECSPFFASGEQTVLGAPCAECPFGASVVWTVQEA